MSTLAEIRKRRIALGIQQKDLARAVGRSPGAMSRIERGLTQPSYELVQRMLGYLEQHEGIAAPHLQAQDLMNPQTVTIDAGEPLSTAARLMEKGGFSQLPVVDGGRVVGSLSESALLQALAQPNGRRNRVRDVQEGMYPQVDEEFPADLLATILARVPAITVMRKGDLVGIVTKIDLIRGLRGTPLRRPGTTSS